MESTEGVESTQSTPSAQSVRCVACRRLVIGVVMPSHIRPDQYKCRSCIEVERQANRDQEVRDKVARLTARTAEASANPAHVPFSPPKRVINPVPSPSTQPTQPKSKADKIEAKKAEAEQKAFEARMRATMKLTEAVVTSGKPLAERRAERRRRDKKYVEKLRSMTKGDE